MEKKSIADKLAQKTFHSAKFQQSWAVHVAAFGPILEPAFADDYQSRVHLTAALNKISQRDIKGGLEKLKPLRDACQNDADRSAWHFFMGLCFEMAGAKEQMIELYQIAGQYGHRFYLPYLKVAKAAHNDAAFEVAEENYLDAIHCFDGQELNGQSQTILASAYTNYASCLTMMHRYEEAEKALEVSEAILPTQPGRAATRAILSAAMGDGDMVAKYLDELERQAPMMVETTRKMTAEILSGEHPHFGEIPMEDTKIAAFWDWFVENEDSLTQKVRGKAFDKAFVMLQAQLKPLFPYLERDPDCAFASEEDHIQITFADYFMVSLEKGYQRLLDACPEELETRWSFTIERLTPIQMDRGLGYVYVSLIFRRVSISMPFPSGFSLL